MITIDGLLHSYQIGRLSEALGLKIEEIKFNEEIPYINLIPIQFATQKQIKERQIP